MKITLDAKDRQLLHLLSQNARRPLTSIAKAMNLSRSATAERLQRLEDCGEIAGYTVRLRTPDYAPVAGWLLVNLRPGVVCAQVVPLLMMRTGVREIHAVSGNIDLMILCRGQSLEDISSVRDAIAGIAGVSTVSTYPVLAAY